MDKTDEAIGRNQTGISRRGFLATGSAMLFAPAIARAQSGYPNRPITMVVAFSAGGGNDMLGRMLAEYLSAHIGQSVVVENRTGGAGNIGAHSVATAKPDGYTIFLGTNGTQALNQLIYKSMPYDTNTSFTNICDVARIANVLICSPSFEPKNLIELRDYIKAHPGKVTAGNSGVGSMSHLGLELLASIAGSKLIMVPYRGTPPIVADLVGGNLDICFSEVASTKQLVETGKVRALGVSSPERWFAVPEIPAISEAFPGYDATSWQVLVGPAGMPRPIVDRLNELTNAFMQDPAQKKKLDELGLKTVGGTPEDLDAFVKSQIDKWGKIIADAGIEAQ